MFLRDLLKWPVSVAVVLSLHSCGGGADGAKDTPAKADTLDTTAQGSGGGLMKVGGELFSIPSPVQTALLIRKVGLPYDKALPMPVTTAANLAGNVQKALALGAYGADLAYLTVHKDGQRALTTLQTVQKLSSDLNLSNAFDQELLDGFKKGLNNEDSLLRFTGKAFRSADQYLKNNKRDDVSALVLAGGWIEGMFLTVSGTTEKTDATLNTRLGEQRETIENLISLLEAGGGTEQPVVSLITGLKDVLAAYQGVTSTYEFRPATTDVAKKTTWINSVSSVTITAEQFKAIAEKVKALRATLTA
ncbi:MAG TPA: hypothetical protein PL002_12045 [Flavobacteriales bacterium]|nr:hypothetical protein [Flavobacteriales bacterium]HNK41912.1 hypothetical protein [Flavobacteriales bacterium]